MINLRKIQKILNQNFSEPFLPEGMVTTRVYQRKNKKFLDISIGRRDVTIDENGKVVGAGILLETEVADINLLEKQYDYN